MNVGVVYGTLQVAEVGRALRVGCTLQEVFPTSFNFVFAAGTARRQTRVLDYRFVSRHLPRGSWLWTIFIRVIWRRKDSQR